MIAENAAGKVRARVKPIEAFKIATPDDRIAFARAIGLTELFDNVVRFDATRCRSQSRTGTANPRIRELTVMHTEQKALADDVSARAVTVAYHGDRMIRLTPLSCPACQHALQARDVEPLGDDDVRCICPGCHRDLLTIEKR
jgi:hypothetical protein